MTKIDELLVEGGASYFNYVDHATYHNFSGIHFKVEKILKGSLDSILSSLPSVKIQIMGGKVCLSCKGKTLLGVVNKLFVFKSLFSKVC